MMKRILLLSCSFVLCLLVGFSFNSAVSFGHDEEINRVLFTTNGEFKEIDNFYKLTAVELIFSQDDFNCYMAEPVYDKMMYSLTDVVDDMKSSGLYDNVECDGILSDFSVPTANTDPYLSKQWYLDYINAKSAWKLVDEKPGEGVLVAVIDSGVYYKHNDLVNNLYRFSGNANLSGLNDDDGHGTHVAGIIGMTAFNRLGGAGIAYSSTIFPIKVSSSKEDSGSFHVSDVIDALNYAIKNKVNVINMSFGAETQSTVFKQTLEKTSKSCVLVAAAGNEGKTTTLDAGDKVENVGTIYPAAYPFVIGVMAHDEKGKITDWSNYDSAPNTEEEYEIAAPGANIFSTYLDGAYKNMYGTSMATPMISAAAAVLYQYSAKLGYQTTEERIKYVYGQLRNTSGENAVLEKDGKKFAYNSLDLYKALSTTPGVNTGVSGFVYADGSTGTYFTDRITINSTGKTDIFCGFDVYNSWGNTKNINISMKIDSENAVIKSEDTPIDKMDAGERIKVDCTNYEAMMFEFTGKPGKTYTIPVEYTVSAVLDDGDKSNKPVVKTFKDSITISVAEETEHNDVAATQVPSQSGSSGSNSAATSDKTTAVGGQDKKITHSKVTSLKVTKKSVKKKYKISISWKKNSKVKRYEIYYCAKKNGRYIKLAVTGKSSYTYLRNKKKGLYYKVRAIYNDGKSGAYSAVKKK